MLHEEIESFIVKFPIYQYSFFDVAEIPFHDEIRTLCKRDCVHFNSSWACAPAVGKPVVCQDKCREYDSALFFSTVASYKNLGKDGDTRNSKMQHDKLTGIVEKYLMDNGLMVYTLTSDVCRLCRKCAYPKESCRNPENMYPCIDSHCIRVLDLLEARGMDYYLGDSLFLWYTIIFFKNQ